MKTAFTGITAALALVISAQAGETQLFNGKDLTGWKGVEGFWSVKDGAISGTTTPENPAKGNTFLVWQGGKPGDFVLTFKYRLLDANGEGKGYASEAALAARAYAAAHFGMPQLMSYLAPANARSIAMAKRLGATYEREHQLHGKLCHVYRHPNVEAA